MTDLQNKNLHMKAFSDQGNLKSKNDYISLNILYS